MVGGRSTSLVVPAAFGGRQQTGFWGRRTSGGLWGRAHGLEPGTRGEHRRPSTRGEPLPHVRQQCDCRRGQGRRAPQPPAVRALDAGLGRVSTAVHGPGRGSLCARPASLRVRRDASATARTKTYSFPTPSRQNHDGALEGFSRTALCGQGSGRPLLAVANALTIRARPGPHGVAARRRGASGAATAQGRASAAPCARTPNARPRMGVSRGAARIPRAAQAVLRGIDGPLPRSARTTGVIGNDARRSNPRRSRVRARVPAPGARVGRVPPQPRRERPRTR